MLSAMKNDLEKRFNGDVRSLYFYIAHTKNEEVAEIITWIFSDDWVNFYELGPYIFVHSFVPTVITWDCQKNEEIIRVPMKWRDCTISEWEGATWVCPWKMALATKKSRALKGKIVVCGHWHTSDFWNHLDGLSMDSYIENPIYKSDFLPSIIGLDDRSVSITQPMIKGATYGLYIGENVPTEMYDGILKGETHGYYGVVNGVADGYQLKEDGEETIDETLYNTCYLVEQDSFLQLKSTGVKYNSLQDAIDAVEENDTIIVLKDHPVRSESTIPSTKTIILDFQDKVLTFTKGLTNNGTLTLTNTVGDKTGGIQSLITKPIVNKGTLMIENGNYSTTTELFLDNFGTLTMNGGTIDVDSKTTNSFAIYNENDSMFTMNDGTITVLGSGAYTYGIYNNSSTYHPVYMVMNDGTITATSTYNTRTDIESTYGANSIYGGYVTIENGNIISKNVTGAARGIVESTVTMNNGAINVTGTNTLGLYNSNFTMNHGTLATTGTSNSYGLYNTGTRTTTINNDSVINSNKTCMLLFTGDMTTINDGNITCGSSFAAGRDGYSSYNHIGTLNINGGTIIADNYGIYGRGTIVMTGGTMTSSNAGVYLINEGADVKIYGGTITSFSSYALYTDDAKDIVSIGVSDDSCESSIPTLTGYTTGVYGLKGTVNVDLANIIGETQYGVYSGGTTNFGIDEEVSDELGEKFAKSIGALFLQMSAKQSEPKILLDFLYDLLKKYLGSELVKDDKNRITLNVANTFKQREKAKCCN